MTTGPSFVIIGASLAGAMAAQTLREEGFVGRIALLGEEPHRPYERPPLSKDYLMGTSERDSVFIHPEGWYAEHDIDLRLDTRVASVDRAAHQVTTAAGDRLGYDKLLLA
nr:FAD-dependent oxidoreductase [Propionibacteriales bacterium]